MQTFLPYPDFAKSAACLDPRRLGKQRVECKQIYLAIVDPDYGWQNHPAVRMWRSHPYALLDYMAYVCQEWRLRGYKDSLLPWCITQARAHKQTDELPAWFGDEAFHKSHRSNLLRKDPKWYGNFFDDVPNNLEYVWPKQ